MIKTKLLTVNTGALMSYVKPLDVQINEFLASNDLYDHLIDIKYSTAPDMTRGTTVGIHRSALIIYNEVEK